VTGVLVLRDGRILGGDSGYTYVGARFAASRVTTSIRRIVAIRPTTRKSSVTKVCDRIENRTVCNISTSTKTTRSRSITSTTVFGL
jgi:hypothetical protein